MADRLNTELQVFKIKLPMRVKTSSKKKQALNLNVYRNLHHRSLHAQKRKFEELAKKLLRGIPPLGVITLHYEVFVETKRRLDVMNVGAIIDKYFSDTLTALGIIRDDDYKHIPRVSFSFGGLVVKEHVLVTITEIEAREAKPMKVLLDENDIQIALTAYVSTLNIPNAAGVTLFNDEAGGIIAEVIFLPTEDPVAAEEAKPKRRNRGGRPKGSKNLPKDQPEETANVENTVSDNPDVGGSGDTPPAEGEASETTPQAIVVADPAKVTAKGNLFGDEGSPSSEDDGKTEDTSGDTPKEPVKKGSIFDA